MVLKYPVDTACSALAISQLLTRENLFFCVCARPLYVPHCVFNFSFNTTRTLMPEISISFLIVLELGLLR